MTAAKKSKSKKFRFCKDEFLYLCLLSFVFVVSTALAISKNTSQLSISEVRVNNTKSRFAIEGRVFSPLPVLKKNTTFPVLSAQAALAVDTVSGVSLYEKDPDKTLLPASTTKIITALVAMDYYQPETIITVGKVTVDGQKMRLIPGEQITVRDLLYGLLVYSANDAAEVLAENYCAPRSLDEVGLNQVEQPKLDCGRDIFIAAMNTKAKNLNLTNSHFTNPAGLDSTGHMSTARDLVRISEVAMQNEMFAAFVATKSITAKSVDGKIVHKLANINELLDSVPGVLGVKTGWTENARENLVTYIERDNHKIMLAILGSQDRFGETKELIDWVFASYDWQEVKYPNS